MKNILILIIPILFILFFPKSGNAEELNLSLGLTKVAYDMPLVRLKVVYTIANSNEPYHTIVLFKDGKEVGKNTINIENENIENIMKELEENILESAPQTNELYFWVWNAEQSSIFQAKVYSKDNKLLTESPLLNVNLNDFIPGTPSLFLKEKQVINGKTNFEVDEKTTEIQLLINDNPVFSQNTNNIKKSISIKIPSGENRIQFIAKNIWGQNKSEPVVVLNTGEEVPYSTFVFVDKSNFRLYFIKDNIIRLSYPVAIGTQATPTPTGYFMIAKKENMGNYSPWGILRLLIYRQTHNGLHWSGYAIHGTNNPGSIGKEASHGCVRLYNEDVLNLSKQVPIGTWVLIIN